MAKRPASCPACVPPREWHVRLLPLGRADSQASSGHQGFVAQDVVDVRGVANLLEKGRAAEGQALSLWLCPQCRRMPVCQSVWLYSQCRRVSVCQYGRILNVIECLSVNMAVSSVS